MEPLGCVSHPRPLPGCTGCAERAAALPDAAADLSQWRPPVYRLVEATYRLDDRDPVSQRVVLSLATPYLDDAERRVSATIAAAIFLHAASCAGDQVLGTSSLADELVDAYILDSVLPADVGMVLCELRSVLERGDRAEVSAILAGLGPEEGTGMLLALCAAGGEVVGRIAAHLDCDRYELFEMLTG